MVHSPLRMREMVLQAIKPCIKTTSMMLLMRKQFAKRAGLKTRFERITNIAQLAGLALLEIGLGGSDPLIGYFHPIGSDR